MSDAEKIVTSNRILYTATSFAKSNLIYLQEIGNLKAQKSHRSTRLNLDSYLFIMVKNGRGRLKYDGSNYNLEEGDIVFIDCRKQYFHETDRENLWELAWIHFYGEAMPAIYDKYISRGGKTVFHPENLDEYLEIHGRLFEVAKSDDYIRDMKLNADLNNLLVLIMEQSWNPEEIEDTKKQNLLGIKEYLDDNYQNKISLDEISNKFGISKFYLTRVFKEKYGVSINTYLCQVRITKAKNMLRFTDEKIETIGRECGLGEPNYFSRIFKNVEGITPSEFRDKW